jgi:hypothetical protein
LTNKRTPILVSSREMVAVGGARTRVDWIEEGIDGGGGGTGIGVAKLGDEFEGALVLVKVVLHDAALGAARQ